MACEKGERERQTVNDTKIKESRDKRGKWENEAKFNFATQ